MDPQPEQPPPQAPASGKNGRPRVLDEKKQSLLVSLIELGIAPRMAAQMVGCTWRTVQNQAKRKPEFAERIDAAKIRRLAVPLQRIIAASAASWRAAAWLVERFNGQQLLAQIERLRETVRRKDVQVDQRLYDLLDESQEKYGA